MPYENDEARRAARERLQARMERRGTQSTLVGGSSRRPLGRSGANQTGSGAAAKRTGSRPAPKPVSTGGRQPQLYTPKSSSNRFEAGPIAFDLPDFIPPIAVPIAAGILVLLLLFAFIVPSCTRAPEPESSGQNVQEATVSSSQSAASPQSSSQASIVQQVVDAKVKAEQSVQSARQVESVDKEENHQAALTELLGEETSAKLLAQAKTNIDALWIAAHPSAFAIDGPEVQYKVIKLAADEPQAIDYVRNFATSYPAEKASGDKSLAMSTSSPSSGVPDTDIPHLYQWDRRWGYTTYSGAAFGLTGCGPTSLSMVYQGLTGKTDKNPFEMGQLANERGYMSEYEGTVGNFFTEMAEELGLVCEELYPDTESIRQTLEHGQTVIANLAPGYFTTNGHYFVITGLTSNGEAIINDPYSVERSSQTWDLDLIVSQSYVCYGYTRASQTAPAAETADDSTEVAETDEEPIEGQA